MALILREMSSTYGKSPGGYIWAVLEPVAAIAVLSVAFSFAFKQPTLGTNFPIFFATGYLPFALWADLAQKVGKSIQFNRQLLAYPAVKYTDALAARFLLNTLTQLSVFCLVISGLHAVFYLDTVVDLEPILISLSMACAFGIAVGSINCYLMAVFPVYERIYAIVTRPLFLISGVIIMYEDLPDLLQSILWYNPLMHLTGLMRMGFYSTYEAKYLSLTYFFGVSIVVATLGFVLLYRHHKTILNA